MTKQFEFSPEIVEEINYQRYNHLAQNLSENSKRQRGEKENMDQKQSPAKWDAGTLSGEFCEK